MTSPAQNTSDNVLQPFGSESARLNSDLERWLNDFKISFESRNHFRVEDFFKRHPEAATDGLVAVELIYEEYCLRRESGLAGSPESVLDRFPQWKAQLEVVFECDKVISAVSDAILFPDPGDEFGDFQLHQELGSGISGRVYLATQPSLSDRPVVLKLSASTGEEHRSLARLQHSAIVPLLFAQEDVSKSIRTLCMPYLGGCTLSKAMYAMQSKDVAKRSGRDFFDAIELHDHRPAAPFGTNLAEPPALQFLASASYEQAVCWITACLADGLHYAHQRGLLHLDVKPSNVLLANDGQPMLLDFHLARERDSVAEGRFSSLGGTPGYMAPEQYKAIKTLRKGDVAENCIDERSDLFSLGLIMHDLLNGAVPPSVDTLEDSPIRSFLGSRANRSVSNADVEATLSKCLANDPELRYASGDAWAADLRRIALSTRELRQPKSGLRLLNDGSDFGSESIAPHVRNDRPKRWQLAEVISSRYRQFLLGLGVGVISTSFFFLSMPYSLTSNETAADAGLTKPSLASPAHQALASELHTLISQARATDAVNTESREQLHQLEVVCQRLWDQRDVFFLMLQQPESQASARRLANDLQDLASLLCESKLKTEHEDPNAGDIETARIENEIRQIRADASAIRQMTERRDRALESNP